MAAAKERTALTRECAPTNPQDRGTGDGANHRLAQSAAQRMGQLLPGRQRQRLYPTGPLDTDAAAQCAAQTEPQERSRQGSGPQSLSQCLLGGPGANLPE